MPHSLRLLLEPLPTPTPGGSRAVTGVRLSLQRRGKGASAASADASTSAEIELVGQFFESALEPDQRETRSLTSLSGEVQLNPSTGQPEMTLTDLGALAAPDTSIVHQGSTPRQLKVELDPASFPKNPDPLLLTLEDVEAVRHLELEAKLKLAGADEGSEQQNDTLDMPLAPREVFKLKLVDELGEGISGATFEFDIGGVLQQVATDANGNARADSLGESSASLRLVDPDSVRAELKQRWNEARSGIYLQAAPGVILRTHSELADPLLLLADAAQILSIRPVVKQARVTGLLFDTNKSFVVPEAIGEMRALKQMYDENPESKLLVVGHTDTSGEASVNDPLSLERAESVAAYLTDDVEVWLKRYDTGPSSRRWGDTEDLRMLGALTLSAKASGALDEPLVSLFQRTHNQLPESRRSANFETLEEDGKLGPNTRRQLIADYMNQDGTTLPEDIELTAHGCGENYPLDASGERLDSDAKDAQEDSLDRRVELFFFDGELGIQPPVPGNNSKPDSPEYPEWRRRSLETRELDVSARGPLGFNTFAPSDVEAKLVISDAAGEVVATLTREQGVQEADNLRFSMLPEVLPSPVEFTVLRNDRVDRQTGLFDALALRDSLFVGDLDKAQQDLKGGSSAGKASPSLAKTQALEGKAPKAATKQKLRVVVRWENERHRFLRSAQPTLKPKDGSKAGQELPLASGSTPGLAGFEIPDDTTQFEIFLKIKSSRATLVDISQNYKIERPKKEVVFLSPGASSFSFAQHPRIHPITYDVGPPGTTVAEIMVNLLFLDVTAHVLSLPQKSPLAAGEEAGRFSVFNNQKAALDIKSNVRILEFTGGKPTTWAAIIPPNTPKVISHSVFLFFKNEALEHTDAQGVVVPKPHKNSDDVNYDRALTPWWGSAKVPGHYVDSERNGAYALFPRFGWDKKLRDSKKTPVVLFPIPHGTDNGVLDKPNQQSRELLTQALLCLFADKHLKTGLDSAPPLIRKLAVGAWSSGTDTLYKWVPVSAPKTSTLVDELWVFDGKLGFPVVMENWFLANPKRKLRLIGTAYTEVASNQVKKNLAGQPNVFVHPGDPKYWYRNPDYKRALSRATAGAVPLQFRKKAFDPKLPNDASTRSNILAPRESFKDNGISVEQSLTLELKGVGKTVIGSTSNEEAATFIVLNHLDPNKLPAAFDGPSFQAAIRAATVGTQDEPHAAFRHRHPWSVFGGLFNHKGRAFVGYFQLCLEESDL